GGFGGGEVRLNPTQGPVVRPVSRGGGDGRADRRGVLALAGVVAAAAVEVAHAVSHAAPPRAGGALRSRPRTTRRGWRWEGSRRMRWHRLPLPRPLPSLA